MRDDERDGMLWTVAQKEPDPDLANQYADWMECYPRDEEDFAHRDFIRVSVEREWAKALYASGTCEDCGWSHTHKPKCRVAVLADEYDRYARSPLLSRRWIGTQHCVIHFGLVREAWCLNMGRANFEALFERHPVTHLRLSDYREHTFDADTDLAAMMPCLKVLQICRGLYPYSAEAIQADVAALSARLPKVRVEAIKLDGSPWTPPTYVPSDPANDHARLVVGFSRNEQEFRVNRYANRRPVQGLIAYQAGGVIRPASFVHLGPGEYQVQQLQPGGTPVGMAEPAPLIPGVPPRDHQPGDIVRVDTEAVEDIYRARVIWNLSEEEAIRRLEGRDDTTPDSPPH